MVGQGNIYVAEAKKQLFGRCGYRYDRRPSEVLIVADDSADADFAAADLLSQLEHDAFASAILVTTSEALVERVETALQAQAARLSRAEIVSRSRSARTARPCSAAIWTKPSPSPMQSRPSIWKSSPKTRCMTCRAVRNAGSVFLGAYTPEPLGDYFAGTNHVLPTNGTARFSSPLSVDDFVKKMSYLQYDCGALLDAAEDIVRFAECKGPGRARREYPCPRAQGVVRAWGAVQA